MKHALITIGLAFVSGAVASVLTVYALAAADREVVEPEDRVHAQEFVLETDDGVVRARLGFSQETGEPGLTLFSDRGVAVLMAGVESGEGPFLALQNIELPNPQHKRARLSVGDERATLELGHGEVEEIRIQSASETEPNENIIRLRARDSSTASFFVDEYGHAAVEVRDKTSTTIFRRPEWEPLLPDGGPGR